jgi:hypothetical protein
VWDLLDHPVKRAKQDLKGKMEKPDPSDLWELRAIMDSLEHLETPD